ncbi:MAG TPA: D-alanyl-D-alanine carboxypeptidase/D-alanyl-D-alanine-endopeptidase [Verrucomicrobiae bacterium]|jgi:N-acyl-D-amino-acid deacylase|nr:D-alanyl-D-alanine carboxypeptidase/D-alanyl-D-alanine-endopeptidase [Verrucomicrobiae bacterium]
MISRVRSALLIHVALVSLATFSALAQSAPATPSNVPDRIQAVIHRPEFAHSHFGIEFYSLDSGKVLYQFHPGKLMVPGSTTKLLTEGTMLESLGDDYRFHTRVYRTGPIKKKGELDGDLILVASGDPDLSGRIQSDGTLAFENEDHSYGGPDSKGIGDPLFVIRELADQIAAKGIKRIKGHVLVDATLFPEGDRELGTNVVISPIVVNDNVIDVVANAGAKKGDPVTLQISPKTSYLTIINQATTADAGSKPTLNYISEKLSPDGTRSVTLTGTLAAGTSSGMISYAVPEPSHFAATVLAEALKAKGVAVAIAPAATADFKTLSANYQPDNLVAEHVSPPLKEDVKITLKVSQNLHASMGPFLLGALVAHKNQAIDQAGFDTEHDFLSKAGLDLSSASQSDGAGGNAFFTADFMVKYLTFMSKQKDFDDFHRGLPILGRDGTLFKIQVNSPAAGHVQAKTGTYGVYDALNKKLMITGKGLAGYMQTTSGDHLAFAAYLNMVDVSMDDPDAAQKIAGEALGEIAAAAYDAPFAASAPPTQAENEYDTIIRNGHVIDGSGNPWIAADIAIRGDRIVKIGSLQGATAQHVIDASGLIVSPGFIDMLGQSEMSLLIDNRSLSKLSQGITTEITGEGQSIAPQDDRTLAPLKPLMDQFHFKIDWTDLRGYFQRLQATRTPLNIGTYVGAAQIREAVLGDDDRAPNPDELEKMKSLVAQAMQQGAFGVSTALIYPPGHYAKTDELIELAKVAAQYHGIYATHMRSEGQTEKQAVEEALRIGREAHLPVEIFHLKVSGQTRWGTMPEIVKMIQTARDGGQDVSADMYPYLAGGTALASSLPPWVADGGPEKLLERLKDPKVRAKIKSEMTSDHPNWENLYFDSGGAKGVMVAGVVNDDLKKYNGKTVAQIAADQKKAPLDALFDFILADKGQTGALYFIASEKDLQYGLKQPWTSLCLDAPEMSLDGPLFEPHTHPRSFGAMTRFLGYYVRDQHLLPIEQAIRKMTSLPAQREGLRSRGLLREGFFADITIFDPATIRDTATYTKPASISEGIKYVFVNGQLEFADGQLTGVHAGKPLYGRGFVSGN